MKPNHTLEFFNDFVKVTSLNDNGQPTIKHTTLADVKKSLQETEYTSPMFPLWVVYYKEFQGNIDVLTCVPKGYLEYVIGTTRYKLHLPYMYFHWHLYKENNMYKVESENLYASFLPPAPTTKLYVPNINNVYPDGHLCWGAVRGRNTAFADLVRLVDIQNLWFNADRNGDLVNSAAMFRANNVSFTNNRDFAAAGHIEQVNAGAMHGRPISEFLSII